MVFNLTFVIIALTAITSFLAFSNNKLIDGFIFNPYKVWKNREYHRFISHGLIHADLTHLLFNMITLYFFGPFIEAKFHELFGPKGGMYFVLLYFLAIIISALPSFIRNKENPYYNSLGASGAVSAILFSFIIFEPLERIYFFGIKQFGIPAAILGIAYLAYSAYMAKRGKDNIGHDAHFVGALFGLLATVALKPSVYKEFVDQIMRAIGG